MLAAGNPLGLQSSVTDGIVSAIGRKVSEGQGVVLPSAIQTSAPINPGNSGGALIDLQGRVVGIPTLAAANTQTGGTAAGIGFAIPSNTVTDIAGQIIHDGHVVNSHRAAIGANLAGSSTQGGAVVVAVEPGGPAARAGIAAGDVIEKIDGAPVGDATALATALAAHKPGEQGHPDDPAPGWNQRADYGDAGTAAGQLRFTIGTCPVEGASFCGCLRARLCEGGWHRNHRARLLVIRS